MILYKTCRNYEHQTIQLNDELKGAADFLTTWKSPFEMEEKSFKELVLKPNYK